MIIDFEQEKENLINIEIKETKINGIGIFARKDFKRGEKVFYVFGKDTPYTTDYSIPINKLEKIEPRISKSMAQYMNHSCEPNIHPDIHGRAYLTMRDINKGEELVTHYGFLGNDFGDEKTIDGEKDMQLDLICKCNTASCRGKLYGYKDFTDKEKKKWNKCVLPFLKNI